MHKKIFEAKNTWKQGHYPAPPLLDREAFDQSLQLLEDPRIVLVMGTRRVGKTTLLLETVRRLLVGGQAPPDRIHYFDFDTMDCADVLASPGTLLDFLDLDPREPGSEIHYLFFDEIQEHSAPGRFLKGLFDLNLPLRIMATGSSALALRTQIRESTVGRAHTLELQPLSAPELPLDETYLHWGGLPELVLADSVTRRVNLLADLWAAYVDREIKVRSRGDSLNRFRDFATLLAAQTGQLVNRSELAGTLGVSAKWVSRYLDFMETSYHVRPLKPYAANRRKELTKMPKIYFSDLGLRNLLAGALPEFGSQDRGAVVENCVEILLRKAGGALNFWRTESGAEVDFIWKPRREPIPIEVKSGNMTRPVVSRGYRSFLSAYEPAIGLVINENLDQEIEVESTRVRFLPLKALPGWLDGARGDND